MLQSSSFVGPLVVGLIADTTGNIRYSFFFLVIMIWLAVPILLSIDIERGRQDAQKYTYRGMWSIYLAHPLEAKSSPD